MKLSCQIIIIISICLSAISFVVGFFITIGMCSLSQIEPFPLLPILTAIFAFSMIVTIPPIIVGPIALYKLNKATTKKELTTIAILTLLFCNMISGILMLCMKDEHLATNKSRPIPQQAPVKRPVPPTYRPAQPKLAVTEDPDALKKEISKVKKEMEELGFSSLEEYKAYVSFVKNKE